MKKIILIALAMVFALPSFAQKLSKEEKAAMERMINPPKEPKRSFPRLTFNLSSPVDFIGFVLLLGISAAILTYRDYKRKKNNHQL